MYGHTLPEESKPVVLAVRVALVPAIRTRQCLSSRGLCRRVFEDRAAATPFDELALAFVRYKLDIEIECTDAIGGGVIVVSRINKGLLEPIHA